MARLYIERQENPMNYFILIAALAASYFVEWIPNNATEAASSPGEFPWQL